jgi:hypothetical protein
VRGVIGKGAACVAGALIVALCLAPAAVAQAPYEPNDTLDTAYGPLASDATYSAILESDDDVDYYYFYVTSQTTSQVDITVTDLMAGGDGGIYAELDDSNGDSVDSVDIDSGDYQTLDDTLDPGKYYLSVEQGYSDQSGEAYTVETGGGGGTFGSKAQVQSRCDAATAAKSAAQVALDRAEKQLKLAREGSHHRKAKARHAVKVAKANLKAANAEVDSWCAIS